MAEIYLAGKVDVDEGDIETFAQELEKRGHIITYKWWEDTELKKPYLDHPHLSNPAANRMEAGVRQSDVFILFTQPRILGAAIELGIAIGDTSKIREKIVVLSKDDIDDREERQSVFYSPDSIIAIRGLDAIRNREWY